MTSYEDFEPKDLVILSYTTKTTGNFGYHKIPVGIRAIHIPTGTVVECESERSQHRNRHLALTELWEQVKDKPSYMELKAQVEALRTVIKLTAEKWQGVTELDATVSVLNRFYNKTPTQCLAEIKAQAGRDGFIAGCLKQEKSHLRAGYLITKAADEYANQLRQAAKGGE